VTAILDARDIVAGYGEMEILHGVSLRLEEGEVVAIIGPNGAGKSTLLKAIFGLVSVRSGSVALSGQDVTNYSPDRIVQTGMSYVPQVDNIFPSLSINENLEMGAFVRQDGLRDRLERVYDLFPDIAGRRGERAGRLSGGQRQMLALARALMLDPKVLLLDEPSASLSPIMVASIFDKIGEINRGGTGRGGRQALPRSLIVCLSTPPGSPTR
jgi:ABC-type branched-subunit amino acid transport system ATPase component